MRYTLKIMLKIFTQQIAHALCRPKSVTTLAFIALRAIFTIYWSCLCATYSGIFTPPVSFFFITPTGSPPSQYFIELHKNLTFSYGWYLWLTTFVATSIARHTIDQVFCSCTHHDRSFQRLCSSYQPRHIVFETSHLYPESYDCKPPHSSIAHPA